MNEFILALFSAEDKLKPSTLYQVLVGKRTSSVLTYAFFHDLLPLSAVLPELAEKQFYEHLRQLQKEQRLRTDGELLSAAAPTAREPRLSEVDFFKYGRKADECWRSVQFLVQVFSFWERKQSYLPLESAPFYTERVRRFVHEHRHEKARFYHELTQLFAALPQEKADFLARSLTGFQQNGAVFFQLLPEADQKSPWSALSIASATHAFFREVGRKPDFLLYQFLKPLLVQNMNRSMLQTRHLFQQGHSFQEVMAIRRLKQGTIQDHVLEWSLLDPQFPFDHFLPHQKELATLPEDSWKLGYKDLVATYQASFLEIRLYQIWRKKQC